MRALRAVSTARGRDPRQFSLIAFGGSGPIHAAPLARELSVERIVIPPLPGLFSAVGLLSSHLEHHDVRSCFLFGDGISGEALTAICRELAENTLAQFDLYGVQPSRVQLYYSADVRFRGQSSEVRVPLANAQSNTHGGEDLRARFRADYERLYGQTGGPNESIEIVAIRVVGRVARSQDAALHSQDNVSSVSSSRAACFGGESLETPVVGRFSLTTPTPGPLLIDEYDSTTVVPPDMRAYVDEHRNIWLEPYHAR
jgi:N-methylhydantoinase A